MSDLQIDEPEVDALDFAFTPPAYVRDDEELLTLYNEIVRRMRAEAQGIPLETNQLLLLAKIALGFVDIKHRDEVGWNGINTQKDANAQWLALLREWNTVLRDNKEKITQKVVDDFMDITAEATKMIRDDDNRRNVRRFLQERFAAKGY